MSEMVSDILDYSQLQAGYLKLSKNWYNLYEIAKSEIIRCRKSAAEHNIDIEFVSDMQEAMMMADASKICQVIRNLLYNAINHTNDNNVITVRLSASNKNIRLEVNNPGEPIPEAERELIWERYQRSQHQGGRNAGTGIGLSIVSAILNAHEIEYGVDCADGITSFWF